MRNEYSIRLVTPADAAGIRSVYAHYVAYTANTFEYEVPPVAEMERRINSIISEYPWLVCEHEGKVIGYAYAHKHRERYAYQWSPESTIYLSHHHHGKGLARILYEALFAILKLQGFINVYAGVLSTNENSTAFHKAMGFEEIGMFHNIGYKLGQWHSNLWYELQLATHPGMPAIPKTMSEIVATSAFEQIIEDANKRVGGLSGVSL